MTLDTRKHDVVVPYRFGYPKTGESLRSVSSACDLHSRQSCFFTVPWRICHAAVALSV